MLAALRAGLVVAAAAAALAAGGTDGRAQPHRRAGHRDHASTIDGVISCRYRHERRGRSVFDPPCSAASATTCPEGMASLDNAIFGGIPDHARRDPGRPQGGADFLRRHVGRLPRRCPARHLSLIAGGARACRSKATCRRAQRSCRPSRRCSFAGLASSLAIWLLSGGTLVLHHPFDERGAGATDQRDRPAIR